MTENWLPLTVTTGGYEISDIGRIRRKGKILRLQTDRYGYKRVALRRDGKAIFPTIHRLVATHFIGPCQNGLVVAHLDGNKLNNHASNLAFVTVAENNRHMQLHGVQAKGERHGTSKLTQEVADYIRDNCRLGDKEFGIRALAKKHNIYPSTVRRIMNNELWPSGDTQRTPRNNEVQALKMRIEALEQALRPFAAAAKRFRPYPTKTEGAVVEVSFTLGQIRAAERAVLNAPDNAPGGPTIDDTPSCGSENDWRKARPAQSPIETNMDENNLRTPYKPVAIQYRDSDILEYVNSDKLMIAHRIDENLSILKDADGNIVGMALHNWSKIRR